MITGFLGLQSIAIAQTQNVRKDQMIMIQINNQSFNQITMNPTNKFEFQPLPSAYYGWMGTCLLFEISE